MSWSRPFDTTHMYLELLNCVGRLVVPETIYIYILLNYIFKFVKELVTSLDMLIKQVISLDKQLVYYKKAESGLIKKLGYSEARTRLTRAVYLFSIGTNDYTSLFLTKSPLLNSTSHSQYVASVVGNLTTVIAVSYILHNICNK